MVILKPTLQMKQAYLDFAYDWENNNESIVPYSARLLGLTYEKWLERTLLIEKQDVDNMVAASTYFLVDEENLNGNNIIGAINIRHRLNEYLLNYGGHIGYGIRPGKRKKGYASLMLSLALPAAKLIGIDNVLIVCNKDNIASAKTIINNGGVFENEVLDNGKIVQRYWIKQ